MLCLAILLVARVLWGRLDKQDIALDRQRKCIRLLNRIGLYQNLKNP